MRVAENKDDSYIIGKVGENDTMQVPFPIGDWLDAYPDCQIHLAYKRPQGNDFYDVQNVEIVGRELIWTVKTVDVEVAGEGIVELQMIRNTQVEKSKFYSIKVNVSAVMGAMPSDPVKDYFLRIIELEQDAIEAKETVTTMSAEAETLESGSEATAEYDHENNIMKFGIPAGENGEKGVDGFSPIVNVSEIEGGHEVTIIDEEGEHTFDVMNGEKGDHGDRGETGYSPSVTIAEITGGHSVTITDEEHQSGQTFNVMDGVTQDISGKMDKNNPTGTGSFSLNRKENTTVGARSFSVGYETEASGGNSHAEGGSTQASGANSHAEGSKTIASYDDAHAEGRETQATAEHTHAEGYQSKATYAYAHAEGYKTQSTGESCHSEGAQTIASGNYSHSEGQGTEAKGSQSHAEGSGTIATGQAQHAQGKYNVEDTQNKFADIIGGGTSSERKNIETVDWSGNMELAGDVKANACGGQNPVSLLDVADDVMSLNQAIDTLPTSETGSEWANKEELNTELVDQFVGEVDRMFSTGLPQESTMGRVITQLSLGNGLLNDLYLGMEVS